MGVFALVYLVGGIVYQRTVMHARGWRQIPHYSVWASALGFIWVSFFVTPFMFVLRIVSCGRVKARGAVTTAAVHDQWKRSDDWA